MRPVLVLADPGLMCSLPEPMLRASAMNALAHGAEALYGPRANPVATLAALRGVELLAAGDRALGSLLCAYAVDSAGYALHHVLGQTTVRVCGTPHADDVRGHPAAHHGGDAGARAGADGAAGGGGRCHPGDAGAAARRAGRRHAPEPRSSSSAGWWPSAALARSELADTPGPPVTAADLEALLAAAAAR